MIEKDVIEKISVLDTKTEAQEKRIDSLEKSREHESRLLTELSTMVKQQEKSQRDFQEFNKDSRKTFETLHQSLTEMSNSQEMQRHVQEATNKEMIKTFEGLRMELHNTHGRMEKIEKNSIINLGELSKEVIKKVVPAIVLAWALLKFGLN